MLLVIQPHRANRHGNPVGRWVLIKWQETTDLTRLFQKAYASRDCGGHLREGTRGLSVRAMPEPGRPAARLKEGRATVPGVRGQGEGISLQSPVRTPHRAPASVCREHMTDEEKHPQCNTGTRRRLRGKCWPLGLSREEAQVGWSGGRCPRMSGEGSEAGGDGREQRSGPLEASLGKCKGSPKAKGRRLAHGPGHTRPNGPGHAHPNRARCPAPTAHTRLNTSLPLDIALSSSRGWTRAAQTGKPRRTPTKHLAQRRTAGTGRTLVSPNRSALTFVFLTTLAGDAQPSPRGQGKGERESSTTTITSIREIITFYLIN